MPFSRHPASPRPRPQPSGIGVPEPARTAEGLHPAQLLLATALDRLTPERVGRILAELVAPATRRLLVVQLTSKDHTVKDAPVPTFTDREAWKQTRTYR